MTGVQTCALPIYGNTVTLTNGTINVYGTAVTPTCSDGIKNQDEIEIDCGGTVCETCSSNPDVCGDGVCTGNESNASCPLDCSIIIEPNPDPEVCGEGFHWITNPDSGEEVCIANLTPSNPLLIVTVIGVIGVLTALYLLFWRK